MRIDHETHSTRTPSAPRYAKKLNQGLLIAAIFTAGCILSSVPIGTHASAQAASGDKVQVWTKAEMAAQTAKLTGEAKGTGLAEALLGNYGNHAVRLLVRTSNGQAEVHPHFNDIIMVTKGQATFVTGGKVNDPKTGDNGEIRGSGIQGGTRRVISPGDVVHVPPATPHQMLIQSGTVFNAVVVKVKE